MFLEFQKVTNAKQSKQSPIIINSDSILKIEYDNQEKATRIDLVGYPKYTFYTLSELDSIISYLTHIDATYNPNATINNDKLYLYPYTDYPLLKVSMVFNNTITEYSDYVFNPIHLIFSEEVFFNDSILNCESSAMMIVLKETSPIKIMTKISYQELSNVLQPIVI